MVAGGKMPVAVPLMFGYVDVRDVAAAHILAMENSASNGERFALAEKDLWYKDVAKLLRDNGFDKAPTIAICLLYTSPSPRDKRQSRMPSSA